MEPQPPARSSGSNVPAVRAGRLRASEAYSAKLGELILRYDGSPLDVSFRELAGPLTVDESAQALHPYPARLLRHIPRFMLGCQQVVRPGSVVLDPFCGSGTVLTEAMRWGFGAWGIDINPLAVLISKVKTGKVDHDACMAAAIRVASTARGYRRSSEPVADSLGYWFGEEARRALQHLRRAIEDHSVRETRDFLLLCFSLTVDAASHKDRRIPVPVRPRGKALPIGDRTATLQMFQEFAIRTIRRLRLIVKDRPRVDSAVELGDARYLSGAPLGPPSLVFTSPPYGAAQKYARSSGQSLEWLGLIPPGRLGDLERKMVGREHISKSTIENPPEPENCAVAQTIEEIKDRSPHRAAIYATYFEDINLTMKALVRVTRGDAKVVIVSSDNTVAGMQLRTHELVAGIAADHGYVERLVLRDRIIARSMTTKRAKTAGTPIRHEFVHLLEMVKR